MEKEEENQYQSLANLFIKCCRMYPGHAFIPIIQSNFLKKLILLVTSLFQEEPILMHLSGDFQIIGDLFGDIFALLQIISINGPPNNFSYIFLGNIIHGTTFSYETLTFLYLLKAVNPHNIYILRGNMEFESSCKQHQLDFHFSKKCDETIYSLFINSFSYLPLAAILNDKYICLHGGIGHDLKNLKQISDITRPIFSYDDPIISQILWSSPSDFTKEFDVSPLHLGNAFGILALTNFLSSTNLQCLIRSHECIMSGVSHSFNDKCVTIFSSSTKMNNLIGIFKIYVNSSTSDYTFRYLTSLTDLSVSYVSNIDEIESFLNPKPDLKLSIPRPNSKNFTPSESISSSQKSPTIRSRSSSMSKKKVIAHLSLSIQDPKLPIKIQSSDPSKKEELLLPNCKKNLRNSQPIFHQSVMTFPDTC